MNIRQGDTEDHTLVTISDNNMTIFLAFRKKKILTLILRPATGRSWLPIPSWVAPKNYKNGACFCVPTPTASCSLTLCVWHRQCVSACAPRGQSASLHPGHTGLYVNPAAHPSLMRFPPSWLMWNSSPAVEGITPPPSGKQTQRFSPTGSSRSVPVSVVIPHSTDLQMTDRKKSLTTACSKQGGNMS